MRARASTSASTSRVAWDSYRAAYLALYGVEPVRNAKVNGQLAQLVKRLPAKDLACTVEHYIRSQNARYVAAGHSVGAMLIDCEKLRTEAITGRSGTAYAARETDKRAGRGAEYRELFAKLDAEDAALEAGHGETI